MIFFITLCKAVNINVCTYNNIKFQIKKVVQKSKLASCWPATGRALCDFPIMLDVVYTNMTRNLVYTHMTRNVVYTQMTRNVVYTHMTRNVVYTQMTRTVVYTQMTCNVVYTQ